MSEMETVKPSVRRSKPSGQVVLRTYVIATEKPLQISFSNHMPRFVGLQTFEVNPDLMWGVFGNDSVNRADSYASMDANHLGRKLYQVDLHYRMDEIPSNSLAITREAAERTGYIYFSRLESTYREELRQKFLDQLKQAKDDQYHDLKGEGMDAILRARPMLVHRFMKENPHFIAALHTVSINGGVSLRMATIRRDPGRISKVHVRYHDEIQATA